ncbi:YdcF family protein [Roseomonas sp. BN140053]|uniref:YdcF family protein n=1 Tax=Roseomonas sp. BN140053 TaxID=3391898 RepID=UPI0039E75EDC
MTLSAADTPTRPPALRTGEATVAGQGASSTRAAIVIFGAAVRPDGSPSPTLRRRVLAARRFGARLHPPPLFVPTGGQGRHGPPEATVMVRLLREQGVAEADLLPEPTGTDTLSSARAVAALLSGWSGPVFAASSGYHIPRCTLLLRLLGLPARPGPFPIPRPGFPEGYWRLRESAALPYDAVLALWHRFRPRSVGGREKRHPAS